MALTRNEGRDSVNARENLVGINTNKAIDRQIIRAWQN